MRRELPISTKSIGIHSAVRDHSRPLPMQSVSKFHLRPVSEVFQKPTAILVKKNKQTNKHGCLFSNALSVVTLSNAARSIVQSGSQWCDIGSAWF